VITAVNERYILRETAIQITAARSLPMNHTRLFQTTKISLFLMHIQLASDKNQLFQMYTTKQKSFPTAFKQSSLALHSKSVTAGTPFW
jgi:hypothetical protein